MLWSNSRVIALLQSLEKKVDDMATALENLQAAVAAQTSVDGSAATLINGLVAQLKAAAAQPDNSAAIQALADQLVTAATPLAAAVSQNTTASANTGATGSAAPTAA